MKQIRAALLLLTTCGAAACGTEQRIASAGTDPAVLAQCPRAVRAPGDLPQRHPFALPDGRTVVPIEEANARENMLVAGALVFKGAWVECRSVVVYVADRDAQLAK